MKKKNDETLIFSEQKQGSAKDSNQKKINELSLLYNGSYRGEILKTSVFFL